MGDVRYKIRAYALLNASRYGSAKPNAVLKKLIAENPGFKRNIGYIRALVEEEVKFVNSLSAGDRDKLLGNLKQKNLLPVKLRTAPAESSSTLPPLPGVGKLKPILRFPPEPSGMPHLGHARASLINYEYKLIYKGRLIFRLEDTNPSKVSLEYYEAFREDLKWLGVEWDIEYIQSLRMEVYYKIARDLIEKGLLYVCTCSLSMLRLNRGLRIECSCRNRSIDENLELFDKMLENSFKPGDIHVRIKLDMNSPNAALRDPTMFRIVDVDKHPHPIVGDRYIVWPTYHFACSVDDWIMGVTHVIRSKEFVVFTPIQRKIHDALKDSVKRPPIYFIHIGLSLIHI